MLEFKTFEDLKPNPLLLELLNNFNYRTENGKVKILEKTNLKFIEPVKYIITYPIKLTILEYKINEINNKPFFIEQYNDKFNLNEIKEILKKFKF